MIQVEVHPDGDGCLVVQWDLEGEGPVDIAVGPTPESIDHAHAVTAAAGERTARLTDLAPGRHYVSVAPSGGGSAVVAAERRVPFEGVRNFRDLGGYRTSSQARTRWGQVFRADALHQLTAVDLVAFERLGLRVVYDLRSDDERSRAPNPMDSMQVALLARLSTGDRPDLSSRQASLEGERWLHEQYVGMLATAGLLFGQLLSGLTDPDGLPAVFHCAAGKDRTGLTAALLLSWLEVPRETVLDDYELTGRWRTIEDEQPALRFLLDSGMSEEAAVASLGAPRWVLADAMATLDDEYGGIEAYLRGPAGMERSTLDELRRRLIR